MRHSTRVSLAGAPVRSALRYEKAKIAGMDAATPCPSINRQYPLGLESWGHSSDEKDSSLSRRIPSSSFGTRGLGPHVLTGAWRPCPDGTLTEDLPSRSASLSCQMPAGIDRSLLACSIATGEQ